MIAYYEPEVITAFDYYPFGMMSRMWYDSDYPNYRFGFNGKEMDHEAKGNFAQLDYGMRVYDPRAGRFLSVDPIASEYPWLTPYQFASNRPIDGIDRDGLEWDLSSTNDRLKQQAVRIKPAAPVVRYFKPWNPDDKTWSQKWRDSDNILAKIAYDIANGLYTLPQQLTASIRNEDYVYNIGGNVHKAHGIEDEKTRLNNFVNGATTLVPASAAPKAEAALTKALSSKFADDVLLGIERQVTKQVPELTALEKKIVNEANSILNSKEFDVLRKAFNEGKEATIKVGDRTLHYSPELKQAGLTFFSFGEFTIGPGAFTKSPQELGKTVLHELYRLYNQTSEVLLKGAGYGEVKSGFDVAPRQFADKAYQYLNQ